MANSPSLSTIQTARVGSVGAGETNLLRLFIPGGLLRNDGDMLHITAGVILAANANNKTTNLYFGATTIASRGPAADNGIGQLIEAWVVRLGAASQQSHGVLMNGISATVVHLICDALVEILSAPIELKITGTGVADNDIVSRFLKFTYLPASSNFGIV